MYTTGEIAAELCLEQPGLDTLDIAVFWGGSPTIASTLTHPGQRRDLAGAYYLEQNAYVPWDPEPASTSSSFPGQHELALALPWGGTSHPVWFRRDPRVANVKVLGGVFNAAADDRRTADRRGGHRGDQGHVARRAVRRARPPPPPQVMNTMPPRENPRRQQVARLRARLRPARPRALRDPRQPATTSRPGCCRRTPRTRCCSSRRSGSGFASGCQAFGHRELLGVLRSFGLVREPRASPVRGLSRAPGRLPRQGRVASAPDAPVPDHRRRSPHATPRCRSSAAGSRRPWPRRGVRPGDKVAILSANDPTAFTCVFGISRAGAVWCPINPRNEAAENRELLDLFDCRALIFQAVVRAAGRRRSAATCPSCTTLVCLDGDVDGRARVGGVPRRSATGTAVDEPALDDLAMIVGTGGTTGRPKGVMLTGANLETMTAITLMSYPFEGRPVYLALAPLTHAAGVLCFPVLALGGEIVVMRTPDVGAFLDARRAAPRHAHVPAADADLHGAGPRAARRQRPLVACSASGTARRRCRWPGSRRR